MPVSLLVEAGPHAGVSRRELTRRARAMLAALGLGGAEWSILLTGDAQIQRLNKAYRGKDRPTDVLAFAQREGELGEAAGRLLGDVIVSVPVARRQAVAARRGLEAELTMLLAHGLLHLLGWDHDTDAKERAMVRETRRLCAAAREGARPVSRARAGGDGAPARPPRSRAGARGSPRARPRAARRP